MTASARCKARDVAGSRDAAAATLHARLRCTATLHGRTCRLHTASAHVVPLNTTLHYTLHPGSEILEKHTLGQVLQIATSGVS